MAPSSVFSYFRSHHRRVGSTAQDRSSSLSVVTSSQPNPSQLSHSADIPTESPISILPPTLPPIPHVASRRGSAEDGSFSRLGLKSGRKENIGPELSRKEEESRVSVTSKGSPNFELKSDDELGPVSAAPATARQAQSVSSLSSGPGLGATPYESELEDATIVQDTVPQQPRQRSPKYATFPRSSSSPLIQTLASPMPARSSQSPSGSSSKLSKAKHLLHPVNLLIRRRTTHGMDIMADDSLGKENSFAVPALSLPANYDPRIRGTGVHDFNAPRPKRNHSANNVHGLGIGQTEFDTNDGDSSRAPPLAGITRDKILTYSPRDDPTPEKERVPVFVEMFEHATSDDNNASAVQRENLENASFLARMAKQLDFDPPSPPSSAIYGRGSPLKIPTELSIQSAAQGYPSDVGGGHSENAALVERESTSPTITSSNNPSQKSVQPEEEFRLLHDLPSHLGSEAARGSRFSFQFNSDRSDVQEKTLESKHPHSTLSTSDGQATKMHDEHDDSSDEDIEQDIDDDDDDDDYEERVPGVNTNDEGGSSPGSRVMRDARPMIQTATTVPIVYRNSKTPPVRVNTEQSHTSDEMYFDDGHIEEPAGSESRGFDETLFDSPVETNHADKNEAQNKQNNNLQQQIRAGNDGKVAGNGTHLRATDDLGYSLSPDPGQPSGLHIDAYHNALASAAAKAAADGRFRSQSMSTTSPISPHEDDVLHDLSLDQYSYYSETGLDDDYDLDDSALEDSVIAAANADALAADDTGFYGTEFQFYGSSHNGGEAANGGYFVPPEALKGSIAGNASREPNLTPITERSEFSARNSFISMGNYGPGIGLSSSALRDGSPLPSPGLKELAARFGKDEDDLTLSQLLKLRKEAFGGSGGPNPFSSSPLASPLIPNRSLGFHSRNASAEEGGSVSSSPPTSDQWSGMPSPLLMRGAVASSSQRARPTLAGKRFSPGLKTIDSSPVAPMASSSLSSSPHLSSARVATSPTPQLPILPSAATMSVPLPPSGLMQKFAARPPASSAAFDTQPPSPARTPGGIVRNQPQNTQRHVASQGADSVTYVKEEIETGSGSDGASDSGYSDIETHDGGKAAGQRSRKRGKEVRWFLERRRTTETGEVVMVGRELVEGGRI